MKNKFIVLAILLFINLIAKNACAAGTVVEETLSRRRSPVSRLGDFFFSNDGKPNYITIAATAAIATAGIAGLLYCMTSKQETPAAEEILPTKKPLLTEQSFFVRTIYGNGFLVNSHPDCTVGEFADAVKLALADVYPQKDWSTITIEVMNGAISMEKTDESLSYYGVFSGSMGLIISLYLPKLAYVYDIEKCVPDLKKAEDS